MKTHAKSSNASKRAALLNILGSAKVAAKSGEQAIVLKTFSSDGTTFERGKHLEVIRQEGRDCLVRHAGSDEDGCWVYDDLLLAENVYNELLKLILSGRLRESCEPLATKGTECIINEDDYININNVLYLNADYFFELI